VTRPQFQADQFEPSVKLQLLPAVMVRELRLIARCVFDTACASGADREDSFFFLANIVVVEKILI
jgi:hypothetical protein